MSSGGETIGIFGAGWVGLVTAACFADLGHRVIVRDIVPRAHRTARAGEVPIYEPGLSELLERNRERMSYTLEVGDVTGEADFLFICVGTPPTYSGDADLSAVWAVIDELPELGQEAILIMKSTVPVGTGEKVRAALERPRSRPRRLRIQPGVPGRRPRDRGLRPSRPDRHRLLRALRRRAGRGSLQGHRGPDRLLRRALGRDDQARLERLPGHAHQLHQRDRQRLRADRRRRRAGRRGDGPRPPNRPALPARGHRLRRQLLPQGRDGAQAARRQLRLPLPAALERDRGQRAAEAPRDRQAREASRLARRQGRSRSSASPSSPTPTTCARRPRSCSARACWPRAPRCAPGIRWPSATATCAARVICDSVLEAVTGADAAVIVTEWDELRELASDEVRLAMRNPLIVDGRNLLDPAQVKAAGFAYECVGRPGSCAPAAGRDRRPGSRTRPPSETARGDHPRWGQGRATRRSGEGKAEAAGADRRAPARRLPDRPSARRPASSGCSSAARPAGERSSCASSAGSESRSFRSRSRSRSGVAAASASAPAS